MEIDKIENNIKQAKKIQKMISKLNIGDCDVSSITNNQITFTITMNKPEVHVIGFHN